MHKIYAIFQRHLKTQLFTLKDTWNVDETQLHNSKQFVLLMLSDVKAHCKI